MKNILRHITVEGFAQSSDLSRCDTLEKELKEAKVRLKLAKKNVKMAKGKLNQALEEILSKIEKKKTKIKENQLNVDENFNSSSSFTETIKLKYEKTLADLELKRIKIKNKIEEYNVEGTEDWNSFKHKLNHDLEELGEALKGFVTKAR